MRGILLAGVVLPFAGFAMAVVLLSVWGGALFHWSYPVLFVVMYLLTVGGITVGFHRLFTHRAFEAPRPVVFVLGVLGSMAMQGPVLKWVAVHRRHHQHSDRPGDPHSPHTHDSHDGGLGTAWAAVRGLWHAHTGWIFVPDEPGLVRYVNDLRKDPMVRSISRLFPLWVLLGLLIPAILGGVLSMTWMGVLLGFIWGGLVRIFFVHHVTWSVNSVCHLWGSRPFACADESRNNAVFGVIALGEGWHNNHHAFPNSARHGLRWWQIDGGYLVIRALGLLGLARRIRIPPPALVAAKPRREGPTRPALVRPCGGTPQASACAAGSRPRVSL